MAYTTAFSPAHTSAIHAAIAKLAERTNYYFAPRSVSYPELLAMTLPVKDHAEALMLPRKYGQYLSPAVFQSNLNFHSAQYNAKFAFSMNMAGPGVFAVEPREREPQDTEESATFRGKLDQWVDNATRIGFVRYMFEIANDTSSPGDKRYVRYLLPGIVPLLKSIGLTDLATRLAPPARDVKTPRIETWHRTGFTIANQIIAESLLYDKPESDAIPSDHVRTQFQHISRVSFTVPPNEALDCPGKQVLVWPHMSL